MKNIKLVEHSMTLHTSFCVHSGNLQIVKNCRCRSNFFFFLNDPATTEIYTLSLHDALPISLIPRAVRAYATRRAEAWMLERLNGEHGLGAIFPAMVNALEALAVLGYAASDARRLAAKRALEKLLVVNASSAYCQPCVSPVWDSALASLALQDPPTSDVTARVVTVLARVGRPQDQAVLARAIAFLRKEQEADGSWFGRWGTNYIYGTWSVLTAFAQAGIGPDDPATRRAVGLLTARQNADGGWGERNDSYARRKLAARTSASAPPPRGRAPPGRPAAREVRRA